MIESGSGVFLAKLYFMDRMPRNIRPLDVYLLGSVKVKGHISNADTLSI
jgi:hypothetical protein